MGKEIIENIRQEISKLNPLGIALHLELTTDKIMGLLIDLKKDSDYGEMASKAYTQLGRTIDKEIYNAIKAEMEANRKNAPKIRQTEYYNAAHKAVEQIKSNLNSLLEL